MFNVKMRLISFNRVTAPNNWQFVFWRFVLLILSFPTTQQCLTRLDNLTLSSITFLFFQSIALTTSKGKQYFCTVFFSFLAWWFMNASNPKQKRREQKLNHPTYLISTEKGCHRTVASAMSHICYTKLKFSEFSWWLSVWFRNNQRKTLLIDSHVLQSEMTRVIFVHLVSPQNGAKSEEKKFVILEWMGNSQGRLRLKSPKRSSFRFVR